MRARLAWALLLSGATAAQGRMNVLFLASDDLRYQLGVSGPGWAGPGCEAGSEGASVPKMLTPNIDRLAAMSLMCHKNYVQQAVCSPTRTSLLTSRRPTQPVSGTYTPTSAQSAWAVITQQYHNCSASMDTIRKARAKSFTPATHPTTTTSSLAGLCHTHMCLASRTFPTRTKGPTVGSSSTKPWKSNIH